jgi:hypothetical protein
MAHGPRGLHCKGKPAYSQVLTYVSKVGGLNYLAQLLTGKTRNRPLIWGGGDTMSNKIRLHVLPKG